MRKKAEKLAKCEVDIYALCEPGTFKPRYIGASFLIRARYSSHLSGCCSATARWVRGLKRAGKRPRMVILETVNGSHAGAAEKKWIRRYDQGGALLNVMKGGYGVRKWARPDP